MTKHNQKKQVIKLVVSLLTIAVIAHTFYSFYSTNNFTLTGISGKAISEDLDEPNSKISFKHRWVLAGEWLFIISILVMSLIRAKMEIHPVEQAVFTKLKSPRGIAQTDLDLMYELTKEKKAVKINALSNYFKVDDKTIIEWARILEEANLVSLNYPAVGEPQIVINEEVKNGTRET